MRKTEDCRVKSRARQFCSLLPRSTVDGVADDGQPDRSQMNPDLVSASGFGENVEHRSLALRKTPRYTPGGLRFTGRRPSHRHAFAILWVAPDRAIDTPFVGAGYTAHNRAIYAFDRMLVKLLREVTMGLVAFGGDQHTRGSPIQAVDDSRSLHTADPGQVVTMVK